MSCWPAVAPLLITRCLYLGWGHQGGCRGSWGCQGVLGYIWNIKMGYCKILLKTQDSLLWTIEHELNATGAKLVPFLAARLLYERGYIWTEVSCMYIGTIIFSGQFYLHYYHSLLSSVVYMLVPFFTTRYLYLGGLSWVCLSVNVKVTLCLTVNVKLTWCSTALAH